MRMKTLLPLLLPVVLAGCSGNVLSGYSSEGSASAGLIETPFSFNGYTDHWQEVYRNDYRYGNLFHMSVPDVRKSLDVVRRETAVSLGLPGMQMQEGFLSFFISAGAPAFLDDSSEERLRDALRTGDGVILCVSDSSSLSQELSRKCPFPAGSGLKAFTLKKGSRRIGVILGGREEAGRLREMLSDAREVVSEYDLRRGWFGAETLVRSVTCTPGNPIDVMGAGMNEGNSWFVFSGLYEFLLGNQLEDWVAEVGSPVVTDLGTNPIYGCDDYEGLQVQEMLTPEDWTRFQQEKHGYIFRDVPETGPGSGAPCDGYFAREGNARQINGWDKPFVIRTGQMLGGLQNSMILFVPKGTEFNRAAMWDAIMSRRAVAVEGRGVVMGPDKLRRTAQLMLLDRCYIEDYFGDRVDIQARVEGHTLLVKVTNYSGEALDGGLSLRLPEHVGVSGDASLRVALRPGATRELSFGLLPSAASTGRLSAVLVEYDWGSSSKKTMASLDLPPAVSVHQLLYGTPAGCRFPVSVHNVTSDPSVQVSVSVRDDSGNEVLREEKTVGTGESHGATCEFDLHLAAGAYEVVTEAMGASALTRLGIGDEAGEVRLETVDIDGDGAEEYVMENDRVRVTLLRTGARVIEYYVKSKDDNVFFKLWPEKPVDDDRPFREWGFYPYGGFEDFLGQASAETHKVYDAEVLHSGGDFAEVRMRGDFQGSVIEKTFTLYGGSPLLGIRFALDMVHPEMNVLGPQPIIEIGRSHDPADRFIFPEADGLHSYEMNTDHYYGKVLYPVEGWNAAQDTREDISFVGAYPVDRPYFMHMWMNLPMNRDSHYSYAELQPWLPLYTGGTSYFSYYMWADGGSWQNGLQELKNRNLITEKQ